MIVTMKKVFLVLTESGRERGIKALRDLGLVHLEDCRGESEALSVLRKKHSDISNALKVLEEYSSDDRKELKGADPDEAVEKINSLAASMREKRDEISSIENELSRLRGWGDFQPDDIKALKESGVSITLFDISDDHLKKLKELNKDKEDVRFFICTKEKGRIRAAVTGEPDLPVDVQPFALPEAGLRDLERRMEGISEEIESIQDALKDISAVVPTLNEALKKNEEEIKFEEVVAGLGKEEGLCYLKGYVPSDAESDLKASAAENGWGVLIDTPADDDAVPTKVKRPGPVKVIKPVFDLMGTTPGYKETDISFMFLLAFTLFVSMIIGDAGYGLIFLVIGVFGMIKMPKGKRLPFQLTSLLALATIAWGAVTGTWFGSQTLASLEYLKTVVIPSIASFPEEGINTVQTVQLFCFSIGLVHLSLARLEMFFRILPKLKAFAELGWLLLLWGLYILVLDIVLGMNTLFGYVLTPIMLPLLMAGFALVILFSNQNGNVIKGVLAGLNPINLLLNFLDGVSAFSNIISYVRLFAVGLASVAVASSFNTMASAIGFTGPAAIGAVLVLFIGHALNIIMAVMSIVVHGIRLNMLEYSGQMGLEWSGIPYEPFAKRAS